MGQTELRNDGVLGRSQARCSDKFAPRSRKVAKRLSSPLKFIADSLPPIIMGHEKARDTEGKEARKGGRRQLRRQILGSKGQSPAFR